MIVNNNPDGTPRIIGNIDVDEIPPGLRAEFDQKAAGMRDDLHRLMALHAWLYVAERLDRRELMIALTTSIIDVVEEMSTNDVLNLLNSVIASYVATHLDTFLDERGTSFADLADKIGTGECFCGQCPGRDGTGSEGMDTV